MPRTKGCMYLVTNSVTSINWCRAQLPIPIDNLQTRSFMSKYTILIQLVNNEGTVLKKLVIQLLQVSTKASLTIFKTQIPTATMLSQHYTEYVSEIASEERLPGQSEVSCDCIDSK